MLYQQIPALFYSLTPKFKSAESVRITHSQYDQLEELISSYCYSHDVPRLKGLIKRVQRRMEQHADHHLWQTEFDFICNHLMGAMKEVGYCRDQDTVESVLGALNRSTIESENRHRRKSRENDHMMFSNSVKQMFDRLIH